MDDFYYHSPTKIIFGKNTQILLGKETKKYSAKILLHYGTGSIKKHGLYDEVVNSLKNENIEFIELGGVLPNPRLPKVEEGIMLCRKHNINFILAVGGGSVIDSAKAIAIGVNYDGDVWDFFGKGKNIESALPVGAVLTLSATGSETSPNSVITNEKEKRKLAIESDLIRPVFAILNPELTYTLPKNQTANGICDMMAHIFERYFTNTANVDLTDELCEATLRSIIHNSKIVMKNPKEYNARANLMLASTIAHNGILGVGREEDWASHLIEHEISAFYDIAHGAGLSIIFPAWMKYVYKVNTEKFVQYAKKVWGICMEDGEKIALEGITTTEKFFKSLGLPTRLKEMNIGNEKFELMAKHCTKKGPIGSFQKLYEKDVIEILKLAL
ncbi:MAG: iron-containing alcohol dehydrogenase [Candidatus Micrarchaeia archaeon]